MYYTIENANRPGRKGLDLWGLTAAPLTAPSGLSLTFFCIQCEVDEIKIYVVGNTDRAGRSELEFRGSIARP